MLITLMQALMEQFRRNEEGQTAVEYGLVIALVALVLAGILATGMTNVINQIVTNILNQL